MNVSHRFTLSALFLVAALATACSGTSEDACDPACEASGCMVCDSSGDAPVCVSTCGADLTCEAGQCVLPSTSTCDPACGACESCDVSGAAPVCVDHCAAGTTCNAGVCEPDPAPTCMPACTDCQRCDLSGDAPTCVDNCAPGTTCNAGVCEAPPGPTCAPACGDCQYCDTLSDPPACIDLCSADEVCEGGTCQRDTLHRGLSALAGPFADGPAVTAACLGCHADEAADFIQTAHWKWQGPTPGLVGHEQETTNGKGNLINNFCIATISNEKRCTQCHAGYGWENDSFDFGSTDNVDCLVCHASHESGYAKDPKTAGRPVATVDLVAAAQSVGRTTRATCGRCHFTAGGGDNVKKGDMGSALRFPGPDTDVHMGKGFDCGDCHRGPDHTIIGQAVHLPITEGRLGCVDCHTRQPHPGNTAMDNHALDIACQTCHVPAFSRQQPTKMDWDWSTAGNRTRGTDGVERVTVGSGEVDAYHYMKGDFVWEQGVQPTYRWYDGRMERMLILDSHPAGVGADATDPVTLGRPVAAKTDAEALIFPFKHFTGQQPASVTDRHMIVPKLFGPGGFWASLPDAASYTPEAVQTLWTSALTAGALAAGQLAPGSSYTDADWQWVHTELYLGINHEVAPAAQALGCMDCHDATLDAKFPWTELGYTCDPQFGSGCGSRN